MLEIEVLLLAVWSAMPICCVFGQAVVSSDILGRITDATGAAVTVTNESTGFTRTVHSDPAGGYLCNDMVSGLYTVSVEKFGFGCSPLII